MTRRADVPADARCGAPIPTAAAEAIHRGLGVT